MLAVHCGDARAISQVRKYLIPDSNDEIRQEQMREMELISTNGDVIDSLKQAANPAQLILHSFPGQVAFHKPHQRIEIIDSLQVI